MIAIGGIIGAGLFVGSSAAIATAGPAIIVSYALSGLLIMLVMRMLGEMAVSRPALGSFVNHIRFAFGQRAGFIAGWLYWYVWVIVIAVEAIAAGSLLSAWLPLPQWVLASGILSLLTGVNLLSSRTFGELEFWLSSIKVSAILIFVAILLAYVLGLTGHGPIGTSNFLGHGGFVPHGPLSIFAGVTAVMFSMLGAEIVTVAAAESPNPAQIVSKLTRQIALRILLFYVLSIGLILLVLPWSKVTVGTSPFGQALEAIGIGRGAAAMNVVVLVAILSCLNSAVYVTSRLLQGLAGEGDAPTWLGRRSRRDVPARAVLLSTMFGYGAIYLSIAAPTSVFSFLVNASGALSLFLYALIGLAQIKLRRAAIFDDLPLPMRMWAFPALSWMVIAGIGLIILSMAFSPSLQTQFYASLASSALAGFAAVVVHRRGAAPRHPTPEGRSHA